MTQAAAVVAEAGNHIRVSSHSNLRVHENLLLGFIAYLTVAAFLFPLDLRQRLAVGTLNLLAAGVILLLGREGKSERSPFLAGARDWLPTLLILVAYRESGLFYSPDPSHHFDYLFIRLDDVLLRHSWVVDALAWSAPWPQRYLEFAYLLCYPIVPVGLASLILAYRRNKMPDAGRSPGGDPSRGRAVGHFWSAVLMASFTCYLLFPLVPLTPPRELFNDVPGPQVAPLLRGMNHWLLGKYSVGASLFPSAHVAATTAMALAIRRYLPRFGWLFVLIAASIALATVYGRYHYAADALAGSLVGVAAFLVSNRVLRADITP